jgi:hypothetical protein
MQQVRSTGGSTTVGFLIGFLTAALGATLAWHFFNPGSAVRIDTSQPTVVRQIQQLQRLETVFFSMDKIVSGGWESRYLPTFLSGERLLLIVYGDVTAGVDLGRVGPPEVMVNGQTVRIKLPDAEVFAARVDNERTRVYSRESGLFTHVSANLESDVRREAERQIRQAALDNGILKTATENARTTLASFLRRLGFLEVEIR